MPGGAGIIIANGAELIAVTTIGNIPKVAGITPPTLNDSILLQGLDGVTNFIQVGATPTTAGNTATFRTKGGIISEGLGPDTVVLGRGATAGGVGNQRSIAIGTLATTGGANQGVVIGYNAQGNGQEAVIVGSTAYTSQAAGVVIGSAANGTGGAGGAAVVAIGNAASARCNNSGNSTAIGNAAVAREGDTVIGHGASSNAVVGVFTNSNVVIGAFAHANVSLAASVAIGVSAVADVVNAVAIGASTTAGHAGATVIGYGTSSISSFSLTIGSTLSDVRTVLFGSGNTQASPSARLFRWTNAAGTDNAAGNVTWRAPLSTGAAVPAKHIFQTGVAHGSDAVLQTATDMLTIDGTSVIIGANTFVVTAATGAVATVGLITQTLAAGGLGYFMHGTSTDAAYMRISNVGTSGYLMAESVVGGGIGTGYGISLFTSDATPLKLGVNNATALTVVNGGAATFASSLAIGGALTGVTSLTAQTVKATALPAFAAGDKYVTVDAAGNFHISALGPAS